jgi:acetyl-CoA carboxylase carboxyltransferase component
VAAREAVRVSWEAEVEELRKRRKLALDMGGPERVQRQHDAGKLTVRERIDSLLDDGSFREVGQLAGQGAYKDGRLESFAPAGYVMGLGHIDGRPVAVGGEDFTVRGGSVGHGMTRSKGALGGFLSDMAYEFRIPMVLLLDGAGANVAAIEDMGHTYLPNNADWSRCIDMMATAPVVGAILGSCAGAPAGHALLTHWNCMVRETSEIFAAGPPVVRRAVGEQLSKQELGGWKVAAQAAGTVDNVFDSEAEALEGVKRYLSYFPQNVWEAPPRGPEEDPERRDEGLLSIVPRDRMRLYDMRKLIRMVFDQDSLFEIGPLYGRSVITSLGRLNGHSVGVIANNPMHNGGALDAAAADKQGHFIEVCDTFHIPLVYFVDVPGFMVGSAAEKAGTLRRGMRALWVGYQATVPQVTVIIRKCYGMGGAATGNPRRLNLRVAWPSAEWGSIPIEGGVDAAFRREIESAPDPAARRREIEERLGRVRSPMTTAEVFGIEDLIDPRDTRPLLCAFLETALATPGPQLGPKLRAGARP